MRVRDLPAAGLRSHATIGAPEALHLVEQVRADGHRDLVLLGLEPVGAGDPAAARVHLRTSSPGTSASSSSAGLPIQWPCCWHGAW